MSNKTLEVTKKTVWFKTKTKGGMAYFPPYRSPLEEFTLDEDIQSIEKVTGYGTRWVYEYEDGSETHDPWHIEESLADALDYRSLPSGVHPSAKAAARRILDDTIYTVELSDVYHGYEEPEGEPEDHSVHFDAWSVVNNFQSDDPRVIHMELDEWDALVEAVRYAEKVSEGRREVNGEKLNLDEVELF